MNKIVLSTLLASSFMFAVDSEEIQTVKTEIQAVNEKIQNLEADLKKLKAKLPLNEAFVTHTELGYIETNGNTQTRTFNLDTNAKKGWGDNSLAIVFDAQYASESAMENKNKFATEINYAYDVTGRFAFGYLAGYKQDKFSSFDYQSYTGPSAIYKVIKTDNHTLGTEAAILAAQDDFRDSSRTEQYASYRAKGDYVWQMFDNLKFTQDISYRGSFEEVDNYFVTSKTAFTSKLSNIFSAGMSYKIDYVNLPANKEYSDTTLTANLIIDY